VTPLGLTPAQIAKFPAFPKIAHKLLEIDPDDGWPPKLSAAPVTSLSCSSRRVSRWMARRLVVLIFFMALSSRARPLQPPYPDGAAQVPAPPALTARCTGSPVLQLARHMYGCPGDS
jgi:hypothetical protein